MTNRKYDLVLLGATGFTGRLVAQYLQQHGGARPWAIAGRNPDKLAALGKELGLGCDVLHADATAPATLEALAASCRVLITTVGPYDLHGAPVLRAAVDGGCDYVDITGEPQFVARSIEEHHARAVDKGLRIVHCCGFDSIPHDLGVLFLLRELGVSTTTQQVEVAGYVRAGGTTFSGGTFHSAINIFANYRGGGRLPLAPNPDRQFSTRSAAPHFDAERGGIVLPLPTIDPQIVLRSASLRADYGLRFTYGHHLVIKRLTTVIGGGLALGAMAAASQLQAGRQWLERLRPSGQGPSARQLERGWFNVVLVGRADGREAMVEVSGGEPGYRETSKMLSESALALLDDRARLSPVSGVGTPAASIGEVLIERLQRAGLKFARIG